MKKLFLCLLLLSLFPSIPYVQAAKDKKQKESLNSTQKKDIQNTSVKDVTTPLVPEEEDDKEFKEKLKEQRRLELENILMRTRVEHELMALRAEIERIRVQREAEALKWEIEQEKSAKEYEKQIMLLNRQKEKILAEVALSQAKISQDMEQFNKVYATLQNEIALSRAKIDTIRAEIETKKTRKERFNYVDDEPKFLENPLQKDGTLVISDRVIKLNGVISGWKADYVVDRIKYFNNKDKTKPIFLIIDESPGGAVLSGFRIIQAMQNSQAVVHVVVKSYAASMAALITTLAKKSYTYPNACILHHQPWTFSVGNLREFKEEVATLQEVWNRLGGHVAKKMGITLASLDKKLYEKASGGNWMEFGDNAVKIKWADHIITNIDDTGVREIPEKQDYTAKKHMEEYWDLTDSERIDSSTIYLPPLAPKDFYYLYNPNNLYQLRTK